MSRMRGAGVMVWLLLGSRAAWAQDPGPGAGPEGTGAQRPAGPTVEERVRRLERENRRLRDDLDALRGDHDFVQESVDRLRPLAGRVTGYLDSGFFAVGGDGAGIRRDIGNQHFPEYAGVVPDSWVFMGDPLSTAVNARGEPAETGESRAVIFDPIDSRGVSSFILNALNLSLFAGISEELQLNASVDFVPRARNVSDPDGLFLGDYVDVKLGYAEYRVPAETLSLSLFAGKFDSVLGIEYRSQEAPDRLTVTPSLLCRYTCGHPIGVKARLQLADDRLALNAAVTNGSHGSEGFPFAGELDSNQLKTAAGRLSYAFPIGAGLEVGASAAYGAQDLQPEDGVRQWHVGLDLHVDWRDLDGSAEFVQGKASGQTEAGGPPCGLAPCLRYKGAYGQLGYRALNWLTPYVRVDWRDALHESGASFAYVSELVRATAGLRSELGTHTIVKAEFTANRELGRIPEFSNDVFTTSLVVKY